MNTKLPEKPDPDILIYFDEPRSQNDVVCITKDWRSTIYKNMKKAAAMGLIHIVGKRAALMRGAPQTLWELTPQGINYLEANDNDE